MHSKLNHYKSLDLRFRNKLLLLLLLLTIQIPSKIWTICKTTSFNKSGFLIPTVFGSLLYHTDALLRSLFYFQFLVDLFASVKGKNLNVGELLVNQNLAKKNSFKTLPSDVRPG